MLLGSGSPKVLEAMALQAVSTIAFLILHGAMGCSSACPKQTGMSCAFFDWTRSLIGQYAASFGVFYAFCSIFSALLPYFLLPLDAVPAEPATPPHARPGMTGSMM